MSLFRKLAVTTTRLMGDSDDAIGSFGISSSLISPLASDIVTDYVPTDTTGILTVGGTAYASGSTIAKATWESAVSTGTVVLNNASATHNNFTLVAHVIDSASGLSAPVAANATDAAQNGPSQQLVTPAPLEGTPTHVVQDGELHEMTSASAPSEPDSQPAFTWLDSLSQEQIRPMPLDLMLPVDQAPAMDDSLVTHWINGSNGIASAAPAQPVAPASVLDEVQGVQAPEMAQVAANPLLMHPIYVGPIEQLPGAPTLELNTTQETPAVYANPTEPQPAALTSEVSTSQDKPMTLEWQGGPELLMPDSLVTQWINGSNGIASAAPAQPVDPAPVLDDALAMLDLIGLNNIQLSLDNLGVTLADQSHNAKPDLLLLSARDVLQLPIATAGLYQGAVRGDAANMVDLGGLFADDQTQGQWQQGGQITQNDHAFNVYQHSGDQMLQMLIDQHIVQSNVHLS